MKEATGELNMTVITVVAIAAVAGIFYGFVWPGIRTSIQRNTCETQCPAPGGTGVDEQCVQTCMNTSQETLNNN